MTHPRLLEPPSQSALREELARLMTADLLGPAGGQDEELDELRVRDRYLVGILAPSGTRVAPEDQEDLAVGGMDSSQDGVTDVAAWQSVDLCPSSCGMTFCLDADHSALRIIARWGQYARVPSAKLVTKSGEPKQVWKRTQREETWDNVTLKEGRIGPLFAQAALGSVCVKGKARERNGMLLVSLFLVNEQSRPKELQDEARLFQPELIVQEGHGKAVFVARSNTEAHNDLEPAEDPDDRLMAMLYRERIEFATGHGASVHVEISKDDPHRALKICTSFVPIHEVPQQTPPTADEIPSSSNLLLDMKELSETGTADFKTKLAALPDSYEQWIMAQEARIESGEMRLTPQHRKAANEAVTGLRNAMRRIREGISLISRDETAAEAFRFANKAMWLQRVRSIYTERFRRDENPEITEIDIPDNRSWRPFQIAFVLLNLPGLTDLRHKDRSDAPDAGADLLWFPTGGGKTEAYLGLTAYTMAIRRLQGDVGGRSGMHGVAVLMRYTLRLLTLQQFQRASTLICACEAIRREAQTSGDGKWGDNPFRIGLWVGRKVTPNRTSESAESVKKGHGHYSGGSAGAGIGSPAQLTFCPWCGSPIDPARDIKVETYPAGRARTLMYCPDASFQCPFTQRNSSGEGLPALTVDEEIYRRLPDLLIATVDKFAQMPWRGEVQTLFGQVTGYCERHGFRSPEIEDADSHPAAGTRPKVETRECGPLRPPDLIIQDELHLISGPLGSLTGLYETAVDDLCSYELEGRTVRPKIIASTATIRRAPDQVHALFLRHVSVFPPPGLDAGDNFFSVEREPGDDFPGRLYLGICAPGARQKAVLIRVYVALLSAGQALFEKYGEAVDPWMTLVGYFNSLRELGGMRRLVDDDVTSRLKRMDRRGLAKRRIPEVAELTSRMGSADIPHILDRLETRFDLETNGRGSPSKIAKSKKKARAIDVLLATSMISVGVDVQRFGLMTVAGQPKSTAEYIQATSRVGRRNPGLVVTVYNWARPRDMSHYETFAHYHATLYRHVEALSVTPFSPRALDRGLSALLASLIRLGGADFNPNDAAAGLDRNHHLPIRAVETVERRVHQALHGKDEVKLKTDLEERLAFWLKEIRKTKDAGSSLSYRETRTSTSKALLRSPGPKPWTLFTCLNSLREVEATTGLILDTRDFDE